MDLPYGWNEIDGAIYALARSKSAFPELCRTLTKGQLFALVPYHPEIAGEKIKIENGSPFLFQMLKGEEGDAVALFTSDARAEEWMKKAEVPPNKFCVGRIESRQMLEILGAMKMSAVLNARCQTGTFVMDHELMRDLANGKALQPMPEEPRVEKALQIIDPADYPTDLIQVAFELLKKRRQFRAAWIFRNPEATAAGGVRYEFLVLMNPRNETLMHDLNLMLVNACDEKDEAAQGYLDENNEAYIASVFQHARPFYIASDFTAPGMVNDAGE